MAVVRRLKVTVQDVEEHGADVRSYRLVRDGGFPRFIPGQFLHLALDEFDPGGEWPESRVFSMASSPCDRQEIRLTISRQGMFTRRILDTLRPGMQVWIKLPYGDFTFGSPDLPRTLIAGGTGIAPFASLIATCLAEKRFEDDLELHYGARTVPLLLYRDLLERYATGNPRFRVHYYLESGSLPGAIPGRIHESAFLDRDDFLNRRYYLSGPRAMIDHLQQCFTAAGLPEERFITDAW